MLVRHIYHRRDDVVSDETYCGINISEAALAQPHNLQQCIEQGTLCYDCYYLHRVDKNLKRYID